MNGWLDDPLNDWRSDLLMVGALVVGAALLALGRLLSNGRY